jgi:hypothetical protein
MRGLIEQRGRKSLQFLADSPWQSELLRACAERVASELGVRTGSPRDDRR